MELAIILLIGTLAIIGFLIWRAYRNAKKRTLAMFTAMGDFFNDESYPLSSRLDASKTFSKLF